MFSGVEYVQEGLQMEQASVLYNIGESVGATAELKAQEVATRDVI